MERTKAGLLVCILGMLFTSVYATPYYGFNGSISLYAKEPPHTKAYQFMVNYDPQRFKWHGFNLYFDAGFSHLWDTRSPYYTTVNIYSIAPVVRYMFGYMLGTRGQVHPYFEFSIGLSYLNHTRLEDRNLGIHFAFQDRFGLGMLLGKAEKFSLGLHAVHYSNAHLSSHNSGITLPVVLDVGYRFQ